MITIKELEKFITGKTGDKGFGIDEGRIFGLTKERFEKVVVCWMATVEAIEFAVKNNADTIICHESLFLPYNAPLKFFQESQKDFMSWSTNAKRIQLLARNNIGVIRVHGNMDKFTILDAYIKQLDLGKIAHRNDEKFYRIVEFPPVKLEKMALKIKNKLKLERVLVIGEKNKKVSRGGLIWGGLGLFCNIDFIESMISLECNVLIGGESDEYAMQYIKDSGVSAIITSHMLSENEGIKVFSRILAEEFKNKLKVLYFENILPYSQL
ncbi:MAG: Nif3-like dinuclear metal center hexameric protein [Candidatus Omnitrophica bacterium]|nr:Nif3-like dinuclear metal center hexameric protein [Candidatus Omnitrophota bacterium]